MDSRLFSGVSGSVDSGAYNDLNRLSQLKVGKDRDGEANVRKVAQEFESLFLSEMLKSMRSANDVLAEGNFLNSETAKQYQSMYDQQLSVSLSRQANGIGLADMLVEQMAKLQSGGRSGDRNPFAHTADTGVQSAAAASSGSALSASGKALPVPEVGRDDATLLNQRRLALPSKLTNRLLAGIVSTPADTAQALTSTTGASKGELAQGDWLPAKSPASVARSALSLDNSDAISGRRIAQPPLAPGKSAFASKDEFIATMLPMAEQASQRIGVDPRYLVAQAALETGWGKSIIRQQDGSSSHNLFGIKAHGGWEGESARVLTTEYKGGAAVKESASFRAYDSYQQSFNDFVSFLQGNGRYDEALDATDNPKQFVRELQEAGYATDPQYARKVMQIAQQMQTYQTIAASDSAPRS